MKKECCVSGLSAILIACFLAVSTAHAAIDSRERDGKKRIELSVVEKKQSERPNRNSEPRRQQRERKH